eukprot:scaffold649395_cov50-Prasinocladus_malaysianus.AAC.1
MVVHMYLWVLATYLGALLYGGFNEARGFVSLDTGMDMPADLTAQQFLKLLGNSSMDISEFVTGEVTQSQYDVL